MGSGQTSHDIMGTFYHVGRAYSLSLGVIRWFYLIFGIKLQDSITLIQFELAEDGRHGVGFY